MRMQNANRRTVRNAAIALTAVAPALVLPLPPPPDEGPDQDPAAAAGADGDFLRRPGAPAAAGDKRNSTRIAVERAEDRERGSSTSSSARQGEPLETLRQGQHLLGPHGARHRPSTTCPGSSRTSTTTAPGAAPTPTPSGFTGPTARSSSPTTSSARTTNCTTSPCPTRPSTRSNTSG